MTWWDMARHEYDTRWLDQTRSGLKLLKWHDLTWSDIKLSWFDFIWPDMAWHKMIRTNHDMAWYEITCSVMASRDVTRHEITRRDTTQRDTRYDRITWCAILIIFHVLSEPIKSIFFSLPAPQKGLFSKPNYPGKIYLAVLIFISRHDWSSQLQLKQLWN